MEHYFFIVTTLLKRAISTVLESSTFHVELASIQATSSETPASPGVTHFLPCQPPNPRSSPRALLIKSLKIRMSPVKTSNELKVHGFHRKCHHLLCKTDFLGYPTPQSSTLIATGFMHVMWRCQVHAIHQG